MVTRSALRFSTPRVFWKAMTMSEGALTRYFDLGHGEWRINASRPGYKVVGCAIEGLRHRLFLLRQVELSEFTKQVPFKTARQGFLNFPKKSWDCDFRPV